MKNKNELKETDSKNRVCYYFDDIINGTKINFSNILLDKKLYENISVNSISYKTPIGRKPVHIRFDKRDGFIIVLDGKTRHLILFDYKLFNKICDKIKYLVSKKSGITNSINHNFRNIRIYSYNSLPVKNILTFDNVIILVITNNYY